MKKNLEERIVLNGPRDGWPERFAKSLVDIKGFRDIAVNPTLFQVTAKYAKGTVRGDLLATFTPQATDTELVLRSSAHVDNVYALFASPNQKLLNAAKDAIH